MSIADDVKSYAEQVLTETRKAAEEGRKPFYALVGLNDLLLEQTKELAERTQAQIDEYREGLIERIAAFREDFEQTMAEGRKRAESLPKMAQSVDSDDVQKFIKDYVAAANKIYTDLSKRGQKLVRELSSGVQDNPVVKRITEATDEATANTVALINRGQEAVLEAQDRTQKAYDDAAKLARDTGDRVQRAANATVRQARRTADDIEDDLTEGKSPARRAAGKKAAATRKATKKAPAKKAPAKKTTAKKTAAKKAPAKKAPAKKTPAKKAPAKTTPASSTSASGTSNTSTSSPSTSSPSTSSSSTSSSSSDSSQSGTQNS